MKLLTTLLTPFSKNGKEGETALSSFEFDRSLKERNPD